MQVLAERDGLVTLGEVDRLLPEATQELQEEDLQSPAL